MLEIRNLSILIGTRYIVSSLSLTLKEFDKLAIIGEEGNGKTTLLKSILGMCNYASVDGTINLKNNKIGYLKQNLEDDELNKSVYDYLFESDDDYYNKVDNLYKCLKEIELHDKIINSKIANLSGGEKIKISILRLLLGKYDILFLDEPSNDLDIESLNWLEKFINNTGKPVIYVSHDETLLSNTANMILHLEQIKNKTECKHTLLKISYDDYITRRFNSISKQTQIAKFEKKEYIKKENRLNQVMQKVEYQQNTISRSNPHGAKLLKKKMKSLKSQEKKMSNLVLEQIPSVEEKINFYFDNIYIPKHKQILVLNDLELKVGNKILSKNIKIEVYGNEHVCIVGKNGAGKTTLLKFILDFLKDRKDIILGYMPQFYDDILLNYDTALDFVCKSKTKEDMTTARMYLGNMNFTKDEMINSIERLSGGSKAKLFLAKLVIDRCNVLILDEPTRNVSPLSNPVIRNVLKTFKGTIISVSHDRKYIKEVADTLYILNFNGLSKCDFNNP